MKKPFITDIQKYSLHDGEGIRTTVFFKGCPLSCVWCHNPETKQYQKQLMFMADSCTGCGCCLKACPKKAISIKEGIAVTDKDTCNACGICRDYCLQNIRELSGKYYTVQELVKEIEKDKIFYENSQGGVTLSGGEVLTQELVFLEELLCTLHGKGYRINIDTSGYAPYQVFERILPYVHTFLYDLKLLDPEVHKKYTGTDNLLIKENLKKLSAEKASIWIRIPVIGGVNASDYSLRQIAEFLAAENISFQQINLLPYHNTGSSKYKRLQKNYEGEEFYTPSEEEMKSYRSIFEQYGFQKVIIGG